MTHPDASTQSTLDARDRFPGPYEVTAPLGAEGWESAYPYYNLFLESRRATESARTWFYDGLHYPEPMRPFEMHVCDISFRSVGVMNSRVFAVPQALGTDVRLVNGYVFFCMRTEDDPDVVAQRAEEFPVRAGYYYQNWNELYSTWEVKVRERIAEVESAQFPHLAELEPLERVQPLVTTSSFDLLVTYQRLLASLTAVWEHHSEMLNLGYAAYLNFMFLCRSHFPEIEDQDVAKMVGGVYVLLFRPDDELRRLAGLGVEWGLVSELTNDMSLEDRRAALAQTDAGTRWLAEYEISSQPWFNFSTGNGFYAMHRSWLDQPEFPMAAIKEYVIRVEAGESLERPIERLQAERDSVVERYRGLIPERDRQAFDEALELCRVVFPYVENHNFYVEHWFMTLFWKKIRELGAVLTRHGVIANEDDIFYLNHSEVMQAVTDVQIGWSGCDTVGGDHWPDIVRKRRSAHEALRAWTPPPLLGPEPDALIDPMQIMLWGITNDQVDNWIAARSGGGSANVLKGFAGSPGVAEGVARVIRNAEDIDQLQAGEILVAPTTSPSWTPVFARIAGAVSDVGGIMSHAAIVCREYALPAVVGTGGATLTIRTGQRIRVDGDAGTVTILAS